MTKEEINLEIILADRNFEAWLNKHGLEIDELSYDNLQILYLQFIAQTIVKPVIEEMMSN